MPREVEWQGADEVGGYSVSMPTEGPAMKEPLERVWARESDLKAKGGHMLWLLKTLQQNAEETVTRLGRDRLQRETLNGFDLNSAICRGRRWEWPWAYAKLCEHRTMGRPDFTGDFTTVLDIGCGLRPFAPWLRAHGVGVMGVDDMSWSTKEDLQHILPSLGIGFIEADGRRLPFKPGTFDYSFCLSVMEHMEPEDIPKMVQEGCRVTDPKGLFIVTIDANSTVESLWPEGDPPEDVVRTAGGAPIAGIVFQGGYG